MGLLLCTLRYAAHLPRLQEPSLFDPSFQDPTELVLQLSTA